MQDFTNTNQDNVEELYDQLFAPWIKQLGLHAIEVSDGRPQR